MCIRDRIPRRGIVQSGNRRANEWGRASMSAIGDALSLVGSMTWEILWALVLGFFLSAVVQAVVRRATAAYEHDEDAIPNPVEARTARGRSSPINRTTVARRTTAWTTAERKNPRTRARRISQVIDPTSDSASPMALMLARSHSFARRFPLCTIPLRGI